MYCCCVNCIVVSLKSAIAMLPATFKDRKTFVSVFLFYLGPGVFRWMFGVGQVKQFKKEKKKIKRLHRNENIMKYLI